MKNKILLETGTNEMELLAVIIDGQYFGMNVAKVQSIQQFESGLVTKMPKSAEGIIGMFSYRKTTIPLIDLAKILGKNQVEEGGKEIIIVTEFNNSINSFKVHGVNQIYRLSWDRLMPLKGIISNNSYVTGSVLIDGHEILVLDLEHILATLFPNLTLEEVEKDVVHEKETISRETTKIFFAEDSSTIRRGVVNALKKAGFNDITEFENGQRAYDFIQKIDKKNIYNTVLISDIEMPVLDGLTLCKNIKADNDLQNIHVVIVIEVGKKHATRSCST